LGRRHVLPMGVEGLEDTHCACTSHRTEQYRRLSKHLTKDPF
jgi:hypothetical protein